MGQLQDRTAVITGATSGIGLATARRFAAEGAHVFITGRRKDALDTAIAEIGADVTGVQGDVANLADLDRLFEAVTRQGRGIDVLFANAGGESFRRLEEIDEQHFDEIFATNVKGLLFTVQKALPLLNEGASVILTGSTSATTGGEAFGVYGASKAAVRSFSRTWANELRGRGIRVNTLTPGPTDTPGITGLAPDADKAVHLKGALASKVPLGRMGSPAEIASVALFLAGDQSSFVTGIELFADGGTNQV
ncbi:SDR family oxidoreductase [Actinoplanes solisilvae]|uniref:SDR family oxidoreductase n=1 Tax=Actinoplanes solisilvae TaxID=2486853 RepID=UPI000FD8387D|nr:SDR family oxidoreductase [Actinoplanes solisilvae]